MGPLRLTWHALLALAGIAAGAALGIALGRPRFSFDQGYAVALAGALGGLAGSRIAHVVELWPLYGREPLRILAVWDGGASIAGGIVGGVLAAALMIHRVGAPFAYTLDVGAIGLGLGMAIGRVGDIVNGEHHAVGCAGLPWCVRYTHPASPGQREYVHPAVAYEMLWDLAIVALLLRLRRRGPVQRVEGQLFLLFLGLYGAGRFLISFLRLDPVGVLGLRQAQLLSVLFVLVSVLGLAYLRREGLARAPAR